MFLCHYTRAGHYTRVGHFSKNKTGGLSGLPGELAGATLQVARAVRVEGIAQAVAHQVDGEDD